MSCESKTVAQLKQLAKTQGLTGYSKMRKNELVAALCLAPNFHDQCNASDRENVIEMASAIGLETKKKSKAQLCKEIDELTEPTVVISPRRRSQRLSLDVPRNIPDMRHQIDRLGGIAKFVETIDINQLQSSLLRALAKDAKIRNRSELDKAKLVAAIKTAQTPRGEEVCYWMNQSIFDIRCETDVWNPFELSREAMAEDIASFQERRVQETAQNLGPHARSLIADLNFELTGHRTFDDPMVFAASVDKQALRKASLSRGLTFRPDWPRLRMIEALYDAAEAASPTDIPVKTLQEMAVKTIRRNFPRRTLSHLPASIMNIIDNAFRTCQHPFGPC